VGENDRKKRRGLHLVFRFSNKHLQTTVQKHSPTLLEVTDFNLYGYSTFSHSLKSSPK